MKQNANDRIRAAIATIPNREGWYRVWKIAAVLWVVVVGAIRLWPEPTSTPPSWYVNTAPIRSQADENQRQMIMIVTEGGIILGVPLAVPVLVIATAMLVGWVREGFHRS